MRVWILEMTPDYEQATRHGVWVRPQVAHQAFVDKVAKLVRDRDEFRLRLERDKSQPLAPVVLEAVQGNDKVTLSGEVVTGAPTDREAELQGIQDLYDLSTLLAAHAADWDFEVNAIGGDPAEFRAYKRDLPF